MILHAPVDERASSGQWKCIEALLYEACGDGWAQDGHGIICSNFPSFSSPGPIVHDRKARANNVGKRINEALSKADF